MQNRLNFKAYLPFEDSEESLLLSPRLKLRAQRHSVGHGQNNWEEDDSGRRTACSPVLTGPLVEHRGSDARGETSCITQVDVRKARAKSFR